MWCNRLIWFTVLIAILCSFNTYHFILVNFYWTPKQCKISIYHVIRYYNTGEVQWIWWIALKPIVHGMGTKRRNTLNRQRNCPSHTISHPSKSTQHCNEDQQDGAQDTVPSIRVKYQYTFSWINVIHIVTIINVRVRNHATKYYGLSFKFIVVRLHYSCIQWAMVTSHATFIGNYIANTVIIVFPM